MAFPTDVTAIFTNAYAAMVTLRASLGLPPMVPASASNFQLGGEFAPQAQVAPRIVIIPTRCEYDYSQPMPITQTPTTIVRLPRKLTYRRWLYFDAQIWGDPDLNPRPIADPTTVTAPGIPDPSYGFNSTLELEREFINAIAQQIGVADHAWQPMGAEWTSANVQNNRYGRLLVLTFRVATQVATEPYTILPYSTAQGDGKVTGVVTVEAELPGNAPQVVAVIDVPPPT